jgi:hypothetical protein
MKSAILTATLAGIASAATWSNPGDVASACTGVGAASDTTAFVAAGSNGVGAEVLKTADSGKTFNSEAAPGAFLLLDAGSNSPTSAVVNGLFGAHYTTDGKTFQAAKGGGGEGQSVEGFGKNSYGIVGAFGGNGVAVSTDGGATFTAHSASSALDNQHPARYGAYPSDTTWYVSAGAWPTNPNSMSDEESLLLHHLNERVQIRKDRKTGEIYHKYLELDQLGSPNNITQYTSAIAKTTDGGKTFTKVFEQDGSFYFNGIHCSSEDHCIAVAE